MFELSIFSKIQHSSSSSKVLQEITQAVFNDDLKLHFYIQSKITTEDNKVGTLMGKDIFNDDLKLHF